MAFDEELLKRLQLQAHANRELEKEEKEKEREKPTSIYQQIKEQKRKAKLMALGDASISEGTPLAANYDETTSEIIWTETFLGGESAQGFADIPCANGVNCLDSNFCYGDYECDPCDHCLNHQCTPKDPNDQCNTTADCPCPPNDEQHYECKERKCKLTCQENSDCGECEVCGLTTGFCEAGCSEDKHCNPGRTYSAGDAQKNTFCQNCECVYACDPVRFCDSDIDCFSNEYCGDRIHRAKSDKGELKQCLGGCRSSSDCPGVESCNPESHNCEEVCIADSDCHGDNRECENGLCRDLPPGCNSSTGCGQGQYCKDGRCIDGCRSSAGVDDCGAPYTCVNNKCIHICYQSSDCEQNQLCEGGRCITHISTEDEPAEDRFGCECGDVCNKFGTCEPAICIVDEDCPSCSVCDDGTCIEGCSDDNACPAGSECDPEGRCAKACSYDYECDTEAGNQVCLEGGYCGLACDPVVACNTSDDCDDGEYCSDEGICLEGCVVDLDCLSLGANYLCEHQYVRRPNGAIAPCEAYPGEQCYSEVGQCRHFCSGDSDCDSAFNETCVSGQCQTPIETCLSDDDCPSINGESQICKIDDDQPGTCSSGCRRNSDCPGNVCWEGQCKFGCSSNYGGATCKALLEDDGAYCRTRYRSGEGNAGRVQYCDVVSSNAESVTNKKPKGCQCFEFCGDEGNCQPYQCDSDLDCQEDACGSCLVGNVCGECITDAECPGTKICDRPLDDNGEFRLYDDGSPVGGICAYSCAPVGTGTCFTSDDCDPGYFCSSGDCERGCESNEDCLITEVCRDSQCVIGCDSDTECAADERCIKGGCRYIGDYCDPENDEVKNYDGLLGYYKQKEDYLAAKIKIAQEEYNAQQGFPDPPLSLPESQKEYLEGFYGLTVEESGQKELYESLREKAVSRDCPSGQVCNSSMCEEPPDECEIDFDCTYPAVCVSGTCQVPPDADHYQTFAPNVIGCESCAEGCIGTKCVRLPCTRNEDCPCGTCDGGGRCVETCQTDFDCGGGFCVDGECLECLSNQDCQSYGEGAVCDGGTCKTPCYTDFSTGDCYNGLAVGDTCQACPDMCPDGAPCATVNKICNSTEVYDPVSQETRLDITFCKVCAKACSSSADCDDGTICDDGYCLSHDGRCTLDNDCLEVAAQQETTLVCRNNTCIEQGSACFSTGDCGDDEVCFEGACVEGECSYDYECANGKVCREAMCGWQCGSDATVYLCGDEAACPDGFHCSAKDSLGGYCLRPGIALSEVQEPGCPSGEFCCDGGCVRKAIDLQCCEDDHCVGGQKCCDGICKFGDCEPGNNSGGTDPTTGETEGTKQNNCEANGLCCGDDGFCVSCGCDEKNPCPQGQCCDTNSKTCVDLTDHPDTKYGAPLSCSFHEVWCEVLAPDEETSIIPSELGRNESYRGCEVIDALTEEVRCWEGNPPNDTQITNMLMDACFESSEKECRCDDEIPTEDECQTDSDCGACAICVEKTFRNDICCGVYGEGTVTDANGVEQPVGIDEVSFNVCEGDTEAEPESCGCRSNDDCTECEFCDGGGADQLGTCIERCADFCPCGGELSKGKKCPSCKNQFGPCATEGTFSIGQEYIDPKTGQVTSAAQSCACVVDQLKECCKGLGQDLFAAQRNKTQCDRINVTYSDGSSRLLQTETCLDFDNDICATCEVDADCIGAQTCMNGQCISECGFDFSKADEMNTAADQGLGEIGGDPYSCWCCSNEGECHARYESYVESKGNEKGPWEIKYRHPSNDEVLTYTSQFEQYSDALSALNASYKNKPIEILSSKGQNGEGDCRPCVCTETGIQCGAWASCDGCYQWEKLGENNATDRLTINAEIMRLENELFQIEEQIAELEDEVYSAASAYQDAQGALNAAQSYLETTNEQLANSLALINEEISAIDDALADNSQDQINKENAIEALDSKIELADFNSLEAEYDLYVQEREVARAELKTLKDNRNTLTDNRKEKTDQRTEVVATESPNDSVNIEILTTAVTQAASTYENFKVALLNAQWSYNKKVNDINAAELPPSVTYRQVRTCECCQEELCRDISECEYGTCYMCVNEDYSSEDGLAYNASLVGEVLKNRIYPGSPDIPEDGPFQPVIMEGKFRYNSLAEGGSCVKYPCGPYYYEERPGYANQYRYYEMCGGSLIFCVFFGASDYLQGWLYNVDMSGAGMFFTTDYVHWVQLSTFETVQPRHRNQRPYTASCLYPNPAGQLYFNTMAHFTSLVAAHPICNSAIIEYGYPDDTRGENIFELEQFFEAGGKTMLIKKLEQEIAEFNATIEAMEYYLTTVDDAEKQIDALKVELLEKKTTAENSLDNSIQAKKDCEKEYNDFSDTLSNQSDDDLKTATDDLANAAAAVSEKQSELDEATQQLIAAQDVLSVAEFELETIEGNFAAAKKSAASLQFEIDEFNKEIAASQAYLTTLDPLSAAYSAEEQNLIDLTEDRDDKASLRSTVVGDMLGYKEDAKLKKREIGWNVCALEEEYTDYAYEKVGTGDCIGLATIVVNAENNEQSIREELGEAYEHEANMQLAKDEIISARETLLTDMKDADACIQFQASLVEDFSKLVGEEVFNPKCCPDGSQAKLRDEGVFGLKDICCPIEDDQINCALWFYAGCEERDCRQICNELRRIEDIYVDIDSARAQAQGEIDYAKQAIENKEEEIEKHTDETGVPAYAVGPVQRPDIAKTYEQIKEELYENVSIDDYLRQTDSWPPGVNY